MYMFQSMMDCHRRLMSAAEALRGELDGDAISPRLLGLRLAMATAARDNLTATRRLWSRIERDVPDIGRRLPSYERLRAAESDLHVRYAHHIAAWPVAAIIRDFRAFADAKIQFLDDLRSHIRALEIEFFEPACRMLHSAGVQDTRAA